MSTRVLLVDDHPVVRAGLRAVLEGLPDITVVAEARDALSAQQRSRHDDIDVVVMDIQMGPGPTGIDATRAIRAAGGPPVLILTTYDTQSDILSALEAGATGYLLKDAPEETLRQAVLDAAANRPVLSPQVTAQLVMRTTKPASALSPREIEILELAATGASNRSMAKQLFISEATVKTHLVHVYNKLNVDNRTAAIDRARQQRII
ncbi:DNA-binding response regulator [Kocuria sp. WRN011]|uniref:Response regulator transcription factor n=1 Tax=Kocuria carniphila TaxID=262208 RepID=A0ABV3V8P3_9MICC|nr:MULTISPECIES: response regulator transcription factor [Kocuria]MCT1803067.1 response regulator transcription factor [Kocuria carniphila]PBB08509.1 DNA-binding response regulator [Kocuria sp. WRN011]PZP30614.1 MAG: DNA-binding response regulator [Kocuria rhizophila]